MGTLPSKTMTLLFSDIEGSTQLVRRLGSGYAATLGTHRRVLRSAWTTNGGTELGTEGDSFFVAFETAEAAVSAAVQGQRELAASRWPLREQVRVRMGLHTGAPTAYDGGYVGIDVHRCARIAGSAHGGQVVVSAATATQLGNGNLPPGVTLRDLGLHQLKDMPDPDHLYQVQADDLPAKFPPLKSIGAISRIPVPPTPLIGRATEIADLGVRLRARQARLLTLTGAGGSGKTRLALELARECVNDFSDGVHFVPFAESHGPDQMWDALAETLGTQRGAADVLARLSTLEVLLLLDNLEQLPEADGVITQILHGTRDVALVATSRRPLHLAEEQDYPVSPLDVPADDTLAATQASPAVQLFVQQARRVRPSFHLNAENAADVADLCRRLDGLPLAIEIVGARAKILSPRALLARVNTGLDMSSSVGGVASRQRTVRATIGWSYNLLPTELQAAFTRLGVFDGGCDLRAVAAVLDDGSDLTGTEPLDVVSSLVDASLVTIRENHDGEPRVLLLETVRAFAVDRLVAAADLDTVRGRHARHYLSVVNRVGPRLQGDRFWQAREELDAEQNNIRAALSWCLSSPESMSGTEDRHSLALRLCAGLCGYWTGAFHFSEARRWLEPVVARAGSTENVALAQCLAVLADSLIALGEPDEAKRHARRAVQMYRDLHQSGWWLAQALRALALATWECGDAGEARLLLQEALEVGHASRTEGPYHRILDHFATLEAVEHHFSRSLELYDEAIGLAEAAGHSTAAGAYQYNRACLFREMGRAEDARHEMGLLIPAILRDPNTYRLIHLAEDYGAILSALGHHQDAARLLGAAEALRERSGYRRSPSQELSIVDVYAAGRRCLPSQDWDNSYAIGRASTVQQLLAEHSSDPSPGRVEIFYQMHEPGSG
ncbi:hypothetical protein ASE25_21830 [Terrabacter sp. Root85]|uniref:ATP-binding protein n=1 Tax=Terrabacter sp. Root85 TaxID=1736603 RepID=UPI0006F537FA|nr:adenylate/guanylate cyclase domain-containing protein [Terrabacter sp. Root85]KRC91068.1 hypothetical protein ASE25_21830 [Terrabacter sp. Root85]